MSARKIEREQWQRIIHKNMIKASKEIAKENPELKFESKEQMQEMLVEKSNYQNEIDWNRIRELKIEKGEIIERLQTNLNDEESTESNQVIFPDQQSKYVKDQLDKEFEQDFEGMDMEIDYEDDNTHYSKTK